MTPARRAELEGDELDPFDSAGVTLQFRPKEHHVALQDKSGRLVASTGMVLADVDIGRERVPVVGFGGVIVAAAYRGRGHGREVLEVALARAREYGRAFVILFCRDDRSGLYRRLGFADVARPVMVEQPRGEAEMPLRTMWRGLREDARWPEGPVVVRGLPF